MSETLRTLAGADLPFQSGRRPTRRPPRRRRGGRIIPVLLVLAGFYVWYATQDRYPIERVIPSGQAYQAYANDLLGKRGKVAQSRIWQALPPHFGFGDLPGKLNQDLGAPEWVLNNLFPGPCHVSGNDLRTFSDVLFVTRTTPVGCMLVKLLPFVPGNKPDTAGGLKVRRWEKAGLYTAARGRLLLISRSRDTLIRALTISKDEALAPGVVTRDLAEPGGEDIRGMIALKPDDPLGAVFQRIGFALRIDPYEVQAKCRAALRAEAVPEPLRAWLEGLGPKPLLAPAEGLVEVSANLDRSVQDTYAACAAFWAFAPWDDLLKPGEGPMGEIVPLVARFLGPLGPGIRVTWRGVDLNEMVPAPEIICTLDATPDELLKAFTTIPPASADTSPDNMMPRYDSESKCVHWPLVGGPSLEPTAAVYGDTLLLSSSRTVAEALLKAPERPQPLPEAGNLFVRVRPRGAVQSIVDVAALFTEYQLLKDYRTKEELFAAAQPWLDASGKLDSIAVAGACENGELRLDLRVVCAR